MHLDPTALIEIAIFAATQIGIGLFFFGGIRSDVKNLTGWVKEVATELKQTRELALTTAAELKAHRELIANGKGTT